MAKRRLRLTIYGFFVFCCTLVVLVLSSSNTIVYADDVNTPPIVDFTYSPEVLDTSKIVTFYARCYDIDGEIIALHWDFGDGSSATGDNVMHTYAKSGVYTVVITAIDNKESSATCSRNLTIHNIKPVARFYFDPETPVEGDTVRLEDASNDNDGVIINYSWSYMDGDVFAYGPNVLYAFDEAGYYHIKLTVTDDSHETVSHIWTISIDTDKSGSDFTFLIAPLAVAVIIIVIIAMISLFMKQKGGFSHTVKEPSTPQQKNAPEPQNQKNMKELQNNEIEAMKNLRQQGLTYDKIAEQTGRSKSTVIKYTKNIGKKHT